MNFVFHVPTKMVFGYGCLSRLHEEKLPGKKALIVITADNTMRQFGYLGRLTHELELAGKAYIVYDRITPNPEVTQIDEGADVARRESCDFVIGLGGGSSMDAAKAIAVAAVNPGSYWDYMFSAAGGKKPLVQEIPLPVVEVTTTAATGSEVDPWLVVSNNAANEKLAFGTAGINHPVLAVIDPELMMSVPPRHTAFQGFDILFHATESILNQNEHEMGEMFAMKALELVANYLPVAVNNGSDREAREKVALANSLAAFHMCTVSMHMMEHVLSAYHPKLAHGAGLILICDAFYGHFIDNHACDDKFIRMAKAMGKADATKASDFADAIRELKVATGMDQIKMSDFGITLDEMEVFAKSVRVMTPKRPADPAPLTEQDFLTIFTKSFS